MNKDLALIKKYYGEKMMHMCRDFFPQILEQEGLLVSLLEKHFEKSKSLADDILAEGKRYEFKDFIFFKADLEQKHVVTQNGKSAVELLGEAGYILYPECQSEQDIQSFEKYWAPGEKLCTFEGGRLRSSRVWFAIKKDIDQIQRKDFPNPNRQDAYGTSAISIQFTRGGVSTCSIKNRYNHKVDNPDNTFASNLDNIIPGLKSAFEHDFGLQTCNSGRYFDFELNNYVKAEGKYFHYNMLIDNNYYCDNNIVIDSFRIVKVPTESCVLADYFVFDMKNKKVYTYDEKVTDCFTDTFGEIEKMQFLSKERKIVITPKNGQEIIVGLDKSNSIISYDNQNFSVCGNNFLMYNEKLEQLKTKIVECGDGFLYFNQELKNADFGCLKYCGESFLCNNKKVDWCDFSSMVTCGMNFMFSNTELEELYMPNAGAVGNYFLYFNNKLKKVNMPKLQYCSHAMLYNAKKLKQIYMPNIKCIDEHFERLKNFVENNKNERELS